MHARGCSCASILWFFSAASHGATVERQVQNCIFRDFCRSLRRDSVAIYGSIWTQFSVSVRALHFLYNALIVS